MALIVQKYGGTSMGSPERIKNVAQRVAKYKAQGHQVVVVVSAMSGETNRLIALAKEIQKHPDPRELDVIISTGEQVTIGLLAMALKDAGLEAKSYTGAQLKALLEEQFGGAYTRMLYPSQGLTYDIHNTAPLGQRVQNLRLNGEPIEAAQTYRVTMNAFLADGGDRFNVAKQGQDAWVGPLDVDAFSTYLNHQSPVAAPQDKRFRNSP